MTDRRRGLSPRRKLRASSLSQTAAVGFHGGLVMRVFLLISLVLAASPAPAQYYAPPSAAPPPAYAPPSRPPAPVFPAPPPINPPVYEPPVYYPQTYYPQTYTPENYYRGN